MLLYNRLEDAKKMRQAQLKSGLPMVDKDDVATLIQKVTGQRT